MFPAYGHGRVRLAACLALCLLAAGCATRSPRGRTPVSGVRRLGPRPSAPADFSGTAPEAVLAAFFAANRLDLPPGERADLLPSAVVQDRVDRAALQRAAVRRDRIMAVFPADADALWDAFDRNLPLLLYIPGEGKPRAPVATLAMPVEWDRESGVIRLYDGRASLRELPADRFFALREPLGQSALCLATERELRRLPLSDRDRTLLLAEHHGARGRHHRAAALYAELAETAPTPADALPALSGQADSLVRLGKPDRAVPLYRRALETSPEDPRLLNNLAYSMLLSGSDPAEALHHAENAVRLDPTNPNALETAGSLRLRLGDAEAAARLLERAWTASRRHPPETQVAIMDQLARAWLAAGRRDLARQVAEHRHRAFPDHAMPRDLSEAFPDLRRPRARHPAPTVP